MYWSLVKFNLIWSNFCYIMNIVVKHFLLTEPSRACFYAWMLQTTWISGPFIFHIGILIVKILISPFSFLCGMCSRVDTGRSLFVILRRCRHFILNIFTHMKENKQVIYTTIYIKLSNCYFIFILFSTLAA